MTFKAAGVLIFLSVCEIVASSPDRAVDCRKFVFAPLCRGVAAKRGILDAEQNGQNIFMNEESFRNLLRNVYSAISWLGTLDDYYQKKELADKHEESLGKKNQQNQYNRFLKLMFDGKTSNSEKDNFPAQDIENL